jgi:hypothetical protein
MDNGKPIPRTNESEKRLFSYSHFCSQSPGFWPCYMSIRFIFFKVGNDISDSNENGEINL